MDNRSSVDDRSGVSESLIGAEERWLESIPANPDAVIGKSDLLTKRVDEAIKFDPNAPINHKTPMEADVAFRKRYEEAQTSDRWMAVVWCIEDGKIVMKGLTTSNFPKGDFTKAIELMRKELSKFEKSESDPPIPEPLPKANIGEEQNV